MRRIGWIGRPVLLLLAMVLFPGNLEASPELPVVGKLVSLQGQVNIRRSAAAQWEAARVGQPLLAGEAVHTGPASRAAILCNDESQIKLNENTILVLKSVTPSPRINPEQVKPAAAAEPAPSIYQILQGEIWLRNKNEKFRFELETPAVTANIRGTEFNVQVKPDGSTHVTLLDGNLCLINPQGEVCLRPGEEGYVIPGQAPSKRLLVQPEDAVQWVLYYPGIISYRDLPMAALPGEGRIPPGSPAPASLIQQGESAYNQGRLDEAKQAAADVLKQDPGNGRALTLLGWVSLQRQAPQEAQGYFQKVRHPDDRAIIGLALASYRLGNVIDAYNLMKAGEQKVGPTPLMRTMTGYFALMVGRVEEAKEDLEAAIRLQPQAAVLARSLLAQIYLVQNRKETAGREATQALAESPGSPLALFSMGLVQMAHFELPGAIQYLEKSLAADPFFVTAYVYLAKIWLGSEYLGRAQKTIDQALHLAPDDAQVLSLAGFIRLAYRDYSRAFELWNRAVKDDPRFGEPHLGLAIYYFRYREFPRGLEEMLTATLLDPRVAPYQTELGKALYQVRAFDRSLEVYDYAKTLDPKDPSPYFYKGIALTDLNRPGEAVQEINRSIELNDNVAMFRSRSLLDQDLAVRNYSLAKSYQQLGLNEWAYSKAVTAVNYHPCESSAHLFLRDVIAGARVGSEMPFLTSGLLFSTASMEAALYRVLSRANQATFSNVPLVGTEALGFTTQYTPMFEMPYGRAVVSGGIGAQEGRHSLQDQQGLIYGGAPGLAGGGFIEYQDNRGTNFPSAVAVPPATTLDSFGGTQSFLDVEGLAKWEPTVHGTLSGFVEYAAQKTTAEGTYRQAPQYPYSTINNTFVESVNARQQLYELAYYHRFNPQAAFLAYYCREEYPYHIVRTSTGSSTMDTTAFGLGPLPIPSVPISAQASSAQTFDRASNNFRPSSTFSYPSWDNTA